MRCVRARSSAALCVACLALTAACQDRRPTSKPLAVRFAGCTEVTKGPVCRLAQTSTVTLFAPDYSPSALRVMGAQVLPQAPSQPYLQVKVDASSPKLSVMGPGRSFHLRIERLSIAPEITRADRLMRAGKLEAADRLIQGFLEVAEGAQRARATGLSARIHLRQGELPAAERLFETAIALDRRFGLISAEYQDRFALTYVRAYIGRDFGAAERLLSPLTALADQYPEGEAKRPYYAGLVALQTGAIGEASRSYAQALQGATELNLRRQRIDARFVLVRLLRNLGRLSEAQELLSEFSPEHVADDPPCLAAERMYNAASHQLLLSQARGVAAPPGLKAQLHSAAQTFRERCQKPVTQAMSAIDLASLLIDEGALSEANSWLDHAETQAAPYPATQLLVLRERARWAEAGATRGQAEAAWSRVGDWALRLGDVAGQRWAAQAQGRIAAARSDWANATVAFARATELIEAQLAEIPFGEGRESFLAAHEALGRAHVLALLQQERNREAFEVARRSRARPLRALAWTGQVDRLPKASRSLWHTRLVAYQKARKRADAWHAEQPPPWTLTRRAHRMYKARAMEFDREVEERLQDALRVLGQTPSSDLPPLRLGPDDRALLLFELDAGWLGFLATTDALKVATTTLSAPRPAAQALLNAHRAQLQTGRRFIVLPAGRMAQVDLHALPLGGEPLLSRGPVVYGLDIATRTATTSTQGSLVIAADPDGTLRSVRSDAEVARSRLAADLRPVHVLSGPQASHAAVLRSLREAPPDLFHFSGHAKSSGRDGWQAGLQLADRAWLTASDLLTLPMGPRVSVLAGCETSGLSRVGAVYGLGLAEALLLVGGETVISTSRPVQDAHGAALVRALYGETWTLDPEQSLRRAQLKLRRSDASVDWAAFRVLRAL